MKFHIMKDVKKAFFVVLFLFALTVNAQNGHDSLYTINGRITDDNDKSLPNVSVLLINLADTTKQQATTTNDNGQFTSLLPAGSYRLRLSNIGYATLSTAVNVRYNMTLPAIRMQLYSTALPEVSVVAKRTVYDLDGYTTKINTDEMFRKRTADEILPFLPGVSKSGDLYTVYDHLVGGIYINGKRINMDGNIASSILFGLSGKRIEQIRINSNVGVEGGSDLMGKAVIYITTVKVSNGGNLSLGDRTMIGKQFRSNAPSADLVWNYGKTSINLWVFDYTIWGKHRPKYSGTTFYNSNLQTESVQKSLLKMKHSPDVDLSVFYDFTKNDKLSVEVTGHHITNQSDWNSLTTIAEGPNKGTTMATTDTTRLNSNSIAGYFDFTHRWTKGHWCIYSELKYDYMRSNNWALMTDYTGTPSNRFNMNQTRTTASATGLYGMQRLGRDITLRYGVGYVWMSGRFRTQQMENNTPERDDYDYTENQFSAYGRYNHSVNKRFEYSIGLRYEYTQATPNSLTSGIEAYNNYGEWLGQAKWHYILNPRRGHSLSMSYNRNISRPHMLYLNPAKKWVSDQAYTAGNPYLRATVSSMAEVALSLFEDYRLSVHYSNNKGIENVYEKVAGENVYCYIPTYGSCSHGFGASFHAPIRLSKKVRMNGSMGYSFSRDQMNGLYAYSNSFRISGSLMANLPWNINSSFGVGYNSPSKSVYSHASGSGRMEMSLSRSFGTFRMNLNADYTTLKIIRLRTAGFESWSRPDRFDGFKITFGVSYSIGWGKLEQYNFKGKVSNELNRF